ncbi:MAG: GntR family transcriptional regulator [Desulfocucumaceae bacterium]
MDRQHEMVEKRLVEEILAGVYPPGSSLPGERELARLYGVTRPTVRSALQRISRDGWIAINERHATTVRDYWTEGNLNVLSAIAENSGGTNAPFIRDLLEVRAAAAPDYTSGAVRRDSMAVVALLARPFDPRDPGSFCQFDWQLHLDLARLSGNRIYPLMLNSFTSLYFRAGALYFGSEEGRRASRKFYSGLMEAAVNRDHRAAGEETRDAMLESLRIWVRLARGGR